MRTDPAKAGRKPGDDAADANEQHGEQHGEGSEQTRTECAPYGRAGWDGVSPVWRVEAQLRSRVLEQLSVRSPAELASSLDSVWHYVVGEDADDERPGRRI